MKDKIIGTIAFLLTICLPTSPKEHNQWCETNFVSMYDNSADKVNETKDDSEPLLSPVNFFMIQL
ncbi:MAG TPA: hypothetical protein VFN30_09085 [Chitinophagaceae bacterium]|nr:hypothetical protein [Chitinophagaceae bacterium]